VNVNASANNSSLSKLFVYFLSGENSDLIGTIDSAFNFGANKKYENSFFIGSTRYGTIKLVPVSGEWDISNVSIQPYYDSAYSVDYFSIKIPIQNSVKNELFEIEAELYDGSGTLCYGTNSDTFLNNALYSPLIKRVHVDVKGITLLPSLRREKPDWFNIRDFGAVGDGVTIDTVPIKAAISASQAAGLGTVYVPDGIFLYEGPLTLPNDPQCDINILGNGSNVSVLRQISASQDGIYFNMDNGGSSDQIYQVGIRGITLECTGSCGAGVYITYGDTWEPHHNDYSVMLDDVQIRSDEENYWTTGSVLETAWNFVFNKVLISGKINDPFVGVGLEIRRTTINGTINQCQFNFWDTGIYVNNVDYTTASLNMEGLLINQTFMVPVRYGLKVIGNEKYFLPPLDFTDSFGRNIAGRVSLVTMIGGHIDSRNDGRAIWLDHVSHHEIIGNHLISDGNQIYMSGSYEGMISSNTLFNPGPSSSIYISGIGTSNVVNGNVFRGGGTHVYLDTLTQYNKVYGNSRVDAAEPVVTDLGTNLVGSTGN